MKLLISACLLGINCKYSGGVNTCPQAAALLKDHELIPVCPEQLGGLPTPRPSAERVGSRVLTQDGLDVTDAYERGAAETLRLASLLKADGAVLKSGSPSCGCGRIYDGTFTHTLTDGDGVTAQLLKEAGLPVRTELELMEQAEA